MNEAHILVSEKSCKRITLGVILAALVLPLAVPALRESLFAYIAAVAEVALVLGFAAAMVMSRLMTSRLKARLPEWRKEIEQSGFGRFFRSRGPGREEQLLSFLRRDSACEQIWAERRRLQRYSALWVYPPSVLVVGLIFWEIFR